jgi:transposase InsO family protein
MKPSKKGTRVWGRVPGQSWEVDFTEVKPGRYGYKYLLVLIDTFSGWVEVFPTKRETAQVVAKVLLEKIIPRYGIPETLGSDNGLAFISNILQGLAWAVGTN